MKGPLGKLAKFSALTWPERRIVFMAMLWLPWFWLGLRVFGLRRFQARLQQPLAEAGRRLALDDAMTMGKLVNIAARHAPCPVTCLTRSLLLDRMLRRRGVSSRLRIGVRLTAGVLDAHAWVEVDGVPVNDRPEVGEQFAPFSDLPSPAAFHSP